jgi:Zn-dependent peptidase ImmA (M78 family)/DNA-binding XRE family transcriptional regulator
MPKTVPANKDVLRWARHIRGLSRREAAEKIRITEQELADIEEHDQHPTVKAFNKMVTVYKQTESTLLLERPPDAQPFPKDFRTISGGQTKLSPDTRLAIRDAQEIQQYVSELVEDDPGLVEHLELPALMVTDDPEQEARKERERIGVPLSVQLQWKQKDSFDSWRDSLERKGVLVLLKQMPWQDCRGFSLLGQLPAIVVNSKDIPVARTFTLFHEYAHLALRTAGICTPTAGKSGVERWCNQFAAAYLLPAQDLKDHVKAINPNAGIDHDWSVTVVGRLATYYRVSRSAMALRLQTLGLALPNYYDKHRSELSSSDKQKPKKAAKIKRKPGWKETKRLKEVGITAATVIVNAWQERIVDPMEAADILNLSLDELHGLQKQTEARRVRNVG